MTKRLPYAPELFQNKKNKVTPEVCAELLDVTIAALEALPEWNEAALHDALMGLVERTGKKTGTVFWPARVGLSALAVTPGGRSRSPACSAKRNRLSGCALQKITPPP